MEFERSNKRNISERNIEEIRGYVINEMNKIEAQIDEIITRSFKPEDEKKFKKIILNSSIISVGGKIKILGNIDGFAPNIIDKIRKLSAIRNSFAHIPILVYFDIEKIEDSEEEFKINSISDKIEVMNPSGKLESKFVKDELRKFESLKNEIIDYFSNYN